MHRAGHKDSRTALRYQHATRDRDKALAESVGRPGPITAKLDPRLHPDGSWWSKLDRAQHHLDDLYSAVAFYTAGRRHNVTKEEAGDGTWLYRVWFTGEVDQDWALLAGDALFNMRAALDHMAVALNPPSKQDDRIYFPIYEKDPWRKDATGEYIEGPRNRRDFKGWTSHMADEAVAIIRNRQPYAEAFRTGDLVTDHLLFILKSFNNA